MELHGLMAEGLSFLKVEEVAGKLVEYEVKDLLPVSRPLCEVVPPLMIYPNPATDFFFINDEIGENAELRIYNTGGQLVLANNQVSHGEKVILSPLASGIYIVHIKTDKTTFQQKPQTDLLS